MNFNDRFRKAKMSKSMSSNINCDDIKNDKIYFSLKEKFEKKNLFIEDSFKEYFIKTKKNENYIICFFIYKIKFEDQKEIKILENIGISDNIIRYLNKQYTYMSLNSKDSLISYKFELIRSIMPNESIKEFLKFVEDIIYENKPYNFHQDYGEIFYRIKYRSKIKNNNKIIKNSKRNEDSIQNKKVNFSLTSKKEIAKHIKEKKRMNKKQEKELADDNTFSETESIENINKTLNKNNTQCDLHEDNIEYRFLLSQTEECIRNAKYVPKTEKEIFEWVKNQRVKNIKFYRKFGGNSY